MASAVTVRARMNVTRERALLGSLFVVGLVVIELAAACSGADPPTIGRTAQAEAGAESGDGSARESSTGGSSSGGGGPCRSCSVDQDCQNACGPASQFGYVWCCGNSTCTPKKSWP